MKTFLDDLVKHTTMLGLMDRVKVDAREDTVYIEGVTDDHQVVLKAVLHGTMPLLHGEFGIPNLPKIQNLLKIEPYKKNCVIEIESRERNGVSSPASLHFETTTSEFQNDHRLQTTHVILDEMGRIEIEKMMPKSYEINIIPEDNAIDQMKWQADIADGEKFRCEVEDGDLYFCFGDEATNAGRFKFAEQVGTSYPSEFYWNTKQVLNILRLEDEMCIQFSQRGIMRITVDSGFAEYTYYLPKQTL
jgi:hypothetical protein